jgi:asparagine synthetase B (glutamine-hydrolysing)
MTGLATTDHFLRCDPLEVAAGWVYGRRPPTPLPESSYTPRQALDVAIRPALAAGPCFVTFSGGRDSSAVLAAATDLARREGFALPVPVTRVYPDLPSTDESTWQRAIVDHLGLTEWIRLELRHGESDLLGDAARAGLRARGLVWPPALHGHDVMFHHLRGGSLLTGEGGDVVLGARRGTPFTLLRNGRRPTQALLGHAAQALLPRVIRRKWVASMVAMSVQSRWLRPEALKSHARRIAADEAAEPLRYDAGTWSITERRSFATISHNHSAVAAEYEIKARDPLLDAGFIAALARTGGAWGYNGRTATMRALFSDVLPPEILARSTKAWFNEAHTGPATRDFARSWDGSGVDHELVDADKLRSVWLSDEPTMAGGMLLHGAWLATEGLSS